MPVTSYAETAIFSKFQVKRTEVNPTAQAILRCSSQKQPFPDELRADIPKICKQILASKVPRSTLLKDQDKQNIGNVLTYFSIIETCGAMDSASADSPLTTDMEANGSGTKKILAAAWHNV